MMYGSFTAQPAEECLVKLGCPARGPVTSFLSLRYRLQSFKVGADILNQDGIIIVILSAELFSNCGLLL